uniref:E3 ubiquitin-protein ligase n=1 Tax=Junco hyemalis TaxID=40217 RepID=A0A8C5JAZ8_JUNHY
MGALTSRQNAGVEEVDIPANSVYRYPPKSGSYFANHFIMGGEKFDSTHPEGYLFGENSDLNFLGNRPVVFPYAAPPPQEPVKTLRSLINIRKDTLRLVKCSEEVKTPGEEVSKAKVHYNVEFTFDTDARVAITIYYQATEEFHNGVASYTPRDNSLQSETVHYKRGVCQQFCVPSHTIDPSEWSEEELGFDLDREVYPMVVQAVVDEGEEHSGHCHVLLATFEKHSDGTFCVKPLKQKQVVDGVSYLLQEIYGIENKYNTQDSKVAEDEVSDNSAECVVCLSDVRDTLILPCRHLCLCNTCADTLRYQANNCPICRLRGGLRPEKLVGVAPSGSSSMRMPGGDEPSMLNIPHPKLPMESENLTLSSSGAIDQSSCTGTPLSSTISSPEEPVSSSLAQSVMSMASSQSQQSQLSTDTVSSMSGSYIAPGTEEEEEEEEEEEGDMLPSPAGNDVLEDEDASPTQEDGKRTGAFLGLSCDNNNDMGIAHVRALDNKLCSEACLPGEWPSAEHELGVGGTVPLFPASPQPFASIPPLPSPSFPPFLPGCPHCTPPADPLWG